MEKTNNRTMQLRPVRLLAALLPLAFLLPSAALQAQDDTLLVAASGPNVMAKNELMWSNRIEYCNQQHFWNEPFGHSNVHGFALGSGLRLGMGLRSELTLDLNAVTNIGRLFDSAAVSRLSTDFVPTVGARVMLYEGRAWLPQVAFRTELSMRRYDGTDLWHMQPLVGLQFRNRIGRRWLLDYSVGYTWTKFTTALAEPFRERPWRYAVTARWLPTARLMLGVGVEDGYDRLEACWQASPDLLVSIQGSARGGWLIANGIGMSAVDLRLGLQWLLR